MVKRRKTARIDLRVTPQEKELYRRAGEISTSGDFSEMADILRTGGTVTAQSIVDIASGRITIDEALKQYRQVLMNLLPEDVLSKAISAPPAGDTATYDISWPVAEPVKPESKPGAEDKKPE